LQVAEKLVPEPVAIIFLHPDITFPFDKNVIFED
jgi:hypothetical protein